MKKYLLILGIIFLFLVAACAQQQVAGDDAAPGDAESGAAMKVPVPGNEDVEEMIVNGGSGDDEPITLPPEEGSLVHDVEPEIVEIDMTAKQFEFVPSTVTVKQGQKVKINAKSIDVPHGFALPDYGIRERLDPGKEVTIEFVADKKGTFTFFCSVACGPGHGAMKGKLVVE